MPEIVLTTRRWTRRLQRRSGVFLVCAVGALAVGSLVAVVLSLTLEAGLPYAYVPPVVTTDSEDGDGDGPALVPGRSLQEVIPAYFQNVGQEALAAGLLPGGTPAGGANGAPSDDPADVSIDVPIDGPVPGSGGNGQQVGGARVSRLLAPAEKHALEVLEVLAPGLAPVAGGVFESTGEFLDIVEGGLPVRLSASRR